MGPGPERTGGLGAIISQHFTLRLGFHSLFSIIQAAGWPIWPLIACSILALAIVIERFISLKVAKVAPPQLLEEVLSGHPHQRARPLTWSNSSKKTRRWVKYWPAACAP